MRLCFYDDYRLGVVRGEEVVDVTNFFPRCLQNDPQDLLIYVMEYWTYLRPVLERLASERQGKPISSVALRAPVPSPSKVVAAPVNYKEHRDEVTWMTNVKTINEQAFFLKAPSSVVGPSDGIRLPFRDRRIDFEGELALVIGREARNVPVEKALEHVFGYCCLLDISLRDPSSWERSSRKSFDTFTPIGPWITTADEVPNPDALQLRTWVNGDLRQDSNTRYMIMSCAEQIAWASQLMTLKPGDILATGTPAGVGPIQPGDQVVVEIERVGRMEIQVY